MKVANPIYDVVFKYLMGDKKVAKLILSRILDEEIESLDFRPTEFQRKIATGLTVFRIDFSAKIKQPDGSHRLVLIEIQKAKFQTDIVRFRRYLGGHYQDENNVYQLEGSDETKPLPIVCIYFLGHTLEYLENPVVKVERNYVDPITREDLSPKEEFIESLTHDAYVIQIPKLIKKRSNKLEVLLSIFDQSQQTPNSRHFLDLDEDNFPPEFRDVIRCLLKAAAEKEVCETMNIEDEILNELESLERTVLKKEKVIEEQGQELEEKNKAIEDKDKALSRALDALIASGMTQEEAKKSLGL